MRYLVTGGAGFIGSKIASKLIEENNLVYIIDNLSTGYLKNIPENAFFIKGDFSDDPILERLNNAKFDAVFHIGGQSSGEISYENPEYDLKSNTLSTLKLLKYCVKNSCQRFIYASSMSVYGEKKGQEQFSETDETNPKSFYAVGKLASEQYMKLFAAQFGIKYTSLRYFNVYGPGQNLDNLKQGMVSIYLKQLIDDNYKEIEVKGDLNRFRDFIYIDDVVDITIDCLKNEKYINEILNVGTGKKTTVSEVLYLLKKYLESNKQIKVSSGTLGDQFGIYANNSKLLKIDSKELTNFDAGIFQMIKWVKEDQNAEM